MKHALLITALISTTALSGCAVTTAAMGSGQERSVIRSINDVSAARVIKARMMRAQGFKLSGVDVEVAEGVVLLSGQVPKKKDRIEAARIAHSAPGIDQVGNEIRLRSGQGLLGNTKDGILEKSIRARLAADKLVRARNLNIETHDGIVYMLGVARTQMELERAAKIASTTRGAKEVVSYVRVADLPAETRQEIQEEFRAETAPPRNLPDFLTTMPQGMTQPMPPVAAEQPAAPMRAAPLSEPIPFEGGSAALTQDGPLHYIDPDSGNKIPVRYRSPL